METDGLTEWGLVVAGQWELIDIRSKQLRNTWQQLVLRDRAEEEERAFFREQAQLLRDTERAQTAKAREFAVQYAEEHAEAIVRGRGKLIADKESKENGKIKKKTARATASISTQTPDGKGESKSSRGAIASLSGIPEDESLDDFPADFGGSSPLPELVDDNELFNMLSQNKASDDSDLDDEPSMASLILPVSTTARSPVKGSTKTQSRGQALTPNKRKRMQANGNDVEFDFTSKGAKRAATKAKAARGEVEVEPEPEATTLAQKKALKRRKDVEKERLARLADRDAALANGGASLRARSLMTEIAASAVIKPMKGVAAKKTGVAGRSGIASQAGDGSSGSSDGGSSNKVSSNVTVRGKRGPEGKVSKAKPGNGRHELKTGKKTAGAGVEKASRQAKPSDSDEDSSDDLTKSLNPQTTKRPKPKRGKAAKLNEMEQALRKADMLTRISQMQQDVATPKVKKKKPLKKSTTNSLAAKRAEFQKIMSANNQNGSSSRENTADAQTPNRAEAPRSERSIAGERGSQQMTEPPKEATPPPEKLQFLAFTKGLSKSPMPFQLRSALKSPNMASPMRKRPRGDPPGALATNDDVHMESPAPSFGHGTSPSESLADLTRAAAADNASRRANAVQTAKTKKKTKVNTFGIPGGLLSNGGGGGSTGFSMFDAFVNPGNSTIPRLKTTSSGDMSPTV